MILTIISGKGGTGKTSLVACFAALASQNRGVVLADCDVDAANLHLLLSPQVERREEFWSGKTASIDPELCTACGECLEQCRFDAIVPPKQDDQTQAYRVDPINCEGCSVCAEVCPVEAVNMQENMCGEWFVSHTRFGPMVHARLGIGEENSGKLVTTVRKEAEEIAKAQARDIILVDGPPGIGCPVIASITGTDAILCVTEPTLSGLSDLERVGELAEHFNINMAVCINKYDLNPEVSANIEDYCRKHDMKLAGKIRFDQDITEAMVKGKTLIEYQPGETADEIKKVWNQVEKILDERKHAPAAGEKIGQGSLG
jgi:MinD superfamily P-loop ATPase